MRSVVNLTVGNFLVTILHVMTNKFTASSVLDALGHQTRREILILLRTGPMSVGTIAQQFPVSRPAISKHLRILLNAGLVDYEERGASNIFRLRAVGFQPARAYLDSFWDEALTNFQRVAENQSEERV